jgi:hypothetical protein
MRPILSRTDFLALIGTRSVTWDQRMKPEVGEAALAFGCSKPAHVGEYPVLHAVAAILASMMNHFTGLELKRSVEIVRRTWDGWLTLLIRAESFPHIDQYVCIAWTSLDRTETPHVAMGTIEEVGETCPPSESPLCMIPINLLLQRLRNNARQAGIDLPARLTVDPEKDKRAYKKWRDEIDAYREAAGARVARTKPLAPA